MTFDDPIVLLGAWTFARTTRDDLTGETMHVEGEAMFSSNGDGLIEWVESGILHHPSGDLPVGATRRVRRAESGDWAVEFADGRPFHPWRVGVEVVHDCSPDLYRGIVTPTSAETWRLRWTAEGPHKDYLLDTSYSRVTTT